MPKISFLVSTYNGDKYLNQRLHNLLNEQLEKDIEVIVLNPASPGKDELIVKSWLEKDLRLKYIQLSYRNNYGEAWLDMWRQASGNYVCNANVDDRLSENFTTAVFNRFADSTAEIAFIYTDMVVLNPFGQIVGRAHRPDFNFDDMTRNCLTGPAVTWLNSPPFKRLLDWRLMYERARQHVSAFDYWLFLYFCKLGYKGVSLQDPSAFVYYLQRPDSIEHQNYGKGSTYESLASISEFFPHNLQPGGRLYKDHKEFADFNNLPPKEEWVTKRLAGKSW